MTDLSQWQESNAHYLSTALTWLRLRLEQQAQPEGKIVAQPVASASTPAPTAPPSEAPSPARHLFSFGGGSRSSQPVETLVLPAPSAELIVEDRLTQAAEAMRAAEQTNPPPALIILSRRFGLSRFEQDILLLCVAVELDTRIPALCAAAQGDSNRPYPTFALALALFDEPAWEALSPERPLRLGRLIEINQPGAQPLTTSALRADERVVNYLKGLNYLDDRLAPWLAPLTVAPVEELPASHQEAVEAILHSLRHMTPFTHGPVIQLVGADPSSKQLIAWHTADRLDLSLYRLPVEWLPTSPAELETLIRLWERESVLLPITLYIDAHDVDRGESQAQPGSALNRFLARLSSLVFLDTRDVWPQLGQSGLVFDLDKPTPVEQQAAWAASFDSEMEDIPARLAAQFNLGLPAIERIAGRVRAEAPDEVDADTLKAQLWRACLAFTRPRMDVLAQRIDTKATWEQLVLPEPELNLLHQMAAEVRQRSRVYDEWGFRQRMNRGLGISALFAGESGTGKTMAAEVLANDLQLNLYRIDLSAVVSKYIGETEKNLRRLFDAAEDGGAVLFFDEADALFGKRSEVKDSHDRYANIEINYLLQRMEAYSGLAVLATNMKNALDQAFVRRLRYIVNFPFPSPTERKRIWQKIFPPQTPTEGLDYDRLARLPLTGGSVHNVALRAAFLAAQAGTAVTMPLVFEAARVEYRKLDKPIHEAEFAWKG